jgi:two-component system cell cycle response regulator CpdR
MQRIRPTLLVVDDDCNVLELSSATLELFGYSVVATTNPVEALRLLQQDVEIAGLVSDFRMPVINGEQLAILAKRLRPELPVFILSGTTPPERLTAVWDAWFVKGSPFKELVVKLDAVILNRSVVCTEALRPQRNIS